MLSIPALKDEARELPIPTGWRGSLKLIADAFVSGSKPAGDGIREIDAKSAQINAANIAAYTEQLGHLRDNAWDTSVYIWMQGYWDALIDLSTIGGERSDLVLHVRVWEIGDQLEFEPGLIYVP